MFDVNAVVVGCQAGPCRMSWNHHSIFVVLRGEKAQRLRGRNQVSTRQLLERELVRREEGKEGRKADKTLTRSKWRHSTLTLALAVHYKSQNRTVIRGHSSLEQPVFSVILRIEATSQCDLLRAAVCRGSNVTVKYRW